MPFKSQAQRRWMYTNKPEMAKQWEDETPDTASLPNRLHPKTKTRRRLTQRRAKRRIGR
tara:strand:- start:3810 stop:3986 length:177 start_codon:yes stop_codon:yes gene_type:complete